MDIAAITLVPLMVISGLCAFILAAAWLSFGHVRHAFTWSLSFSALSLMWLTRVLLPSAGAIAPILFYAIGGFAVAFGAMGFRQRAALPAWGGALLGLAGVQTAATIALALLGVATPLLALPFYLQCLAMLALSVRTLRGRRRTERVAERGIVMAIVAGAGWIIIRLAEAFGIEDDRLAALQPLLLLVQPLAVTAVGLFVIFLIAADFADRMRRLAGTDRLTGLLNRRGLDDALQAMLASGHRHGRPMALVIADIDRFKTINDRFGHAIGDAAIRAFGRCLSEHVARRDIVARVGGEEFAIVMADVDAETARCAAEVLRERVADLAVEAEPSLALTASFGIAPAPVGTLLRHDLRARADAALYTSKALGRNRVTVAD